MAPTVDFGIGSAESLAWPDGSFDAVLSQFGLMFFADRAAAAREMMRVLVPGGRLVVAVWASLSETRAFAAEVETLEHVAGSRAADALRALFVMGDRAELVRLLEGAGASGIDVATRRARAEFPTARSLVEADVRGWLPLMGAVRRSPALHAPVMLRPTPKSWRSADGPCFAAAPSTSHAACSRRRSRSANPPTPPSIAPHTVSLDCGRHRAPTDTQSNSGAAQRGAPTSVVPPRGTFMRNVPAKVLREGRPLVGGVASSYVTSTSSRSPRFRPCARRGEPAENFHDDAKIRCELRFAIFTRDTRGASNRASFGDP